MITNNDIIVKLTKDFPDHSFGQKTNKNKCILTIDGKEGTVSWATLSEEATKLLPIKDIEDTFYNAVCYEVKKYFNKEKN